MLSHGELGTRVSASRTSLKPSAIASERSARPSAAKPALPTVVSAGESEAGGVSAGAPQPAEAAGAGRAQPALAFMGGVPTGLPQPAPALMGVRTARESYDSIESDAAAAAAAAARRHRTVSDPDGDVQDALEKALASVGSDDGGGGGAPRGPRAVFAGRAVTLARGARSRGGISDSEAAAIVALMDEATPSSAVSEVLRLLRAARRCSWSANRR